MSSSGCVLKESLYLLALHHPSRAEKGLSSSDYVQSLVTNLWATCAPQGHFLHSRPGGLCDLISEQAILPNLPFLPISRELKVQIVDLILLRSSRTSLRHCCSPHCWILVVSPLIPSRNGPVHRKDAFHFTHWCSSWSSEPLCSVRRWPLAVPKAKKAWNSHVLCLGASAKTLGLVDGFGKWYIAFPGISQSSGSSLHSWRVPCLLSYIFITLFLILPS